MSEKSNRSSKKQARTLLISLIITFVVLLVLNLIVNSGVLEKLYPSYDSEESESIFLHAPDFEEDIFLDEFYMSTDRFISYTDGALTTVFTNEDELSSADKGAKFFGKYFKAVITGDHNGYNKLFTENYLNEHGKKQPFTMQKIYDIRIVKISEYTVNEGQADQAVRYEFSVCYRIMQNNGTFRSDVASNAIKEQIYVILEYPFADELMIDSISNVKYKN